MPVLIDVTMPRIEATESSVAVWLKKPGDSIRLHEPLLEVSTDKATVEVPSPASGILREALKNPGDPVETGDVLGRIEPANGQAASAGTSKAASVQAATPSAPADLSPAVRALVKQHGLDVSRIRGTGRGGRITHDDVQNHLKEQVREPAAPARGPASNRKVPHSQMRRTIAQHMVASMLKTAPHVTSVFDVDLSAIVAHRKQHADGIQKRGARLTYTAYFVAAAVKALQAVPEVNSRWHDDGLELLADCNIGVAASVPGGLVVPVLMQAQKLDLFAIAQQLEKMTAKARAGKLDLADMRHGTFTITNHGVGGSLIATPIINQPQSAILGIGKMEKRVVAVEQNGVDAIQIQPRAYVTLTIDHRALDGFQANRFLTAFVAALRSPDTLFQRS